jgi:hypothetical protein
MARRTRLDRPTRTQRKRSGRYRESLKGRGIPFKPQRRK